MVSKYISLALAMLQSALFQCKFLKTIYLRSKIMVSVKLQNVAKSSNSLTSLKCVEFLRKPDFVCSICISSKLILIYVKIFVLENKHACNMH